MCEESWYLVWRGRGEKDYRGGVVWHKRGTPGGTHTVRYCVQMVREIWGDAQPQVKITKRHLLNSVFRECKWNSSVTFGRYRLRSSSKLASLSGYLGGGVLSVCELPLVLMMCLAVPVL